MPAAPRFALVCASDDGRWAAPLGADVARAGYPATLAEAAEADLGDLEAADVVVLEWDADRAPIFGALCHRLRAPHRLVAAACRTRADVVMALVTGADWAAVGAASAPELLAARIARTRAADAARPLVGPPAPAEAGPLRIDDRRKTASVAGAELRLTPRLYDLLAYLVARSGETVTRDDLLTAVWGLDFDPETNVVDVYVHYLRRQLRPHGVADAVVTVRGRGYRLDVGALS